MCQPQTRERQEHCCSHTQANVWVWELAESLALPSLPLACKLVSGVTCAMAVVEAWNVLLTF